MIMGIMVSTRVIMLSMRRVIMITMVLMISTRVIMHQHPRDHDEHRAASARHSAGYLPSATVVFLDEIFRASPSLLNVLLRLLEGRTAEVRRLPHNHHFHGDLMITMIVPHHHDCHGDDIIMINMTTIIALS